MESIRKEYQTIIEANLEENRAAAWKTREYLLHSSVAYHGRCVRTLQIPKVFTPAALEDFRQIVRITYGIFQKVIREYLDNPAYRRLFPFSRELEELILVPSLYDSLLPIARFDIFYNEETGDFKFCEINTDGTSAMNEDYVLNRALDLNPAHQSMKRQHAFGTFELYDSWVRTFLSIYDTYEKKKEHPHVVIADFLENASITEFEEFQRRFEKAGVSCEIAEITELTFRDRHLISPTGRVIDAVYRRAVTSDVMAHAREVQPFLQAVKEQAVCLIGAFQTQIIHNKWLFKLLHEEPTLSLLTPSERDFVKAHVPRTNLLTRDLADPEQLVREKKPLAHQAPGFLCFPGRLGRLRLRPRRNGGSIWRNPWTGITFTRNTALPLPRKTSASSKSPAEFKPYTNMSGLFVYNGQFAGVYSRLSDGGIISSQYNEKAVPTLFLTE